MCDVPAYTLVPNAEAFSQINLAVAEDARKDCASCPVTSKVHSLASALTFFKSDSEEEERLRAAETDIKGVEFLNKSANTPENIKNLLDKAEEGNRTIAEFWEKKFCTSRAESEARLDLIRCFPVHTGS